MSDAIPQDPAEVIGQVEAWQGQGSAVAEARVAGPGGPIVLARGQVEDSGHFRLDLPARVEAELLVPLASYLPCPNVSVSPARLEGLVLSSLVLTRQGVEVGMIAQASSQEAIFPWPQRQGDYRVFRWYAAQESQIEGSCSGQVTQHWDLQLKEGWNVVLETVVELSDASATLRYTVTPEAAAARWYLQNAVLPPTP